MSNADTRIGRRVVLRPLVPSDFDALYFHELVDPTLRFVRYYGSTPSIDSYRSAVMAGAELVYLVEPNQAEVSAPNPVGIVSLYSVDYRSSYGYIAAMKFDPEDVTARIMDAVLLLVADAFTLHPFRRLYFESHAHYGFWESGEEMKLLQQVARFPEREFIDGAYRDVVIHELTAATWNEHGVRFLKFARPQR